MMTPEDRELLSNLIAEHLDDDLSEPRRATLNTLLLKYAEARTIFNDEVRRDVQLREILHERHELEKLKNAPKSVPATPSLRAGFWTRARAIGAFAAIVIIAVLLSLTLKRTDTSSAISPFATIISASSDGLIHRNGATLSATAGASLFANDTVESQIAGPIALKYPDGSQLTLSQKSIATFTSYGEASKGKRVALERGSLTGDITPQLPASPMVLNTADAEATVLGTRFRLSRESGRSILDVEHGRVRFVSKIDQRNVEVTTGQSYEFAAAPSQTVQTVPKHPRVTEVLFVTAKRMPFFAHDVTIQDTLDQNHFHVTEKTDDEVTAQDAQGKSLIIVSSYLCSKKHVFRDVGVPLIAWHRVWFEDLGMSPSVDAKAGAPSLRPISFVRFDHPLAAGLKLTDFAPGEPHATLPVYATGDPGKKAAIIATIETASNETVLFGFEKGAVMDRVTAPARRVGFSFHLAVSDGLQAPADISKRLFQAAISWCLETESEKKK